MDSQENERLKTQMIERASLFRKLTDRFGKEILSLVAEHTSDQVRDGLTKENLQRRDLDRVMELLWDQMGEGFDFQVEQRSPQRL